MRGFDCEPRISQLVWKRSPIGQFLAGMILEKLDCPVNLATEKKIILQLGWEREGRRPDGKISKTSLIIIPKKTFSLARTMLSRSCLNSACLRQSVPVSRYF